MRIHASLACRTCTIEVVAQGTSFPRSENSPKRPLQAQPPRKISLIESAASLDFARAQSPHNDCFVQFWAAPAAQKSLKILRLRFYNTN